MNVQTGAPVSGVVSVALEDFSEGNYVIAMMATADAQGHFHFDNVTPTDNGWLIAVSAKASDGTVFAPSYLFSGNSEAWSQSGDKITAGTDVGVITVTPSPTVTLNYTVTSQNPAGLPQDVNVVIDPLRSFTTDRWISVPWLSGPPSATTHAGAACANQSESCATFSLTVPTARVWWAVYNHNGNQFQSWGTPETFSMIFNAVSKTTGAQDCNPSSQVIYSGSLNSPPAPGTVHFQSCTP